MPLKCHFVSDLKQYCFCTFKLHSLRKAAYRFELYDSHVNVVTESSNNKWIFYGFQAFMVYFLIIKKNKDPTPKKEVI